MSKKVLNKGLDGNIVQHELQFKKAPPRKWVEPKWLKEYKLERDRLIWKLHPESRKEIEEYYGSKTNQRTAD